VFKLDERFAYLYNRELFIVKLREALKSLDDAIGASKVHKSGYRVDIVLNDMNDLLSNNLTRGVLANNFRIYESPHRVKSSFAKFKYSKLDSEELDSVDDLEMSKTNITEIINIFNDVFFSAFPKIDLEDTDAELSTLYLIKKYDNQNRHYVYFKHEGEFKLLLTNYTNNFLPTGSEILDNIGERGIKLSVFTPYNNFILSMLIASGNIKVMVNKTNKKSITRGALTPLTQGGIYKQLNSNVVKLVATLIFRMENESGISYEDISYNFPTHHFNIPTLSVLFPYDTLNKFTPIRGGHTTNGLIENLFRWLTSLPDNPVRQSTAIANFNGIQRIYFDVFNTYNSTYSNFLILESDFFALAGIQSPYINNEGNRVYIVELEALTKIKSLGIKKTVEHLGYKFNVFKDNAEENVKKRGDSTLPYAAGVRSYSDTIPALNFVDVGGVVKTSPESGKLYMGPEFEFDDGGQDNSNAELFLSALTNLNPFAWVTRDGSLRNGFEGKTIPATLEAHMDPNTYDYKLAFDIMKKLGYTGFKNNTCGLHVHVSKSFFETSDFSKVVGVIGTILELNWSDLVTFTRRGSSENITRWASKVDRLSNVLYLFHRTDGKLIPKEQVTISRLNEVLCDLGEGYNRSRHSAVHGLKNNTIEFRVFKGTLDYTSYIATLQLVRNICYAVKENYLHPTNQTALNGLARLFSMTLKDFVEYHKFDELTTYYNNMSDYFKD
jgi:hypothetical protein